MPVLAVVHAERVNTGTEAGCVAKIVSGIPIMSIVSGIPVLGIPKDFNDCIMRVRDHIVPVPVQFCVYIRHATCRHT